MALFNASVLIKAIGESVVLRLYAAPTREEGFVVPQAPYATKTLKVSVQPAPGADVDRLPEGVRDREAFLFYVPDSVDVLAEGGGDKPHHRFFWKGCEWDVQQPAPWLHTAGFTKVLATRRGEG